jgi:mRNA-degrading endonuclease HigB of HigAB toxin-antitoxin module
MKIHLIKKQAFEDFTLKHAGSKKSFQIWLTILKNAAWSKPSDVFAIIHQMDWNTQRIQSTV